MRKVIVRINGGKPLELASFESGHFTLVLEKPNTSIVISDENGNSVELRMVSDEEKGEEMIEKKQIIKEINEHKEDIEWACEIFVSCLRNRIMIHDDTKYESPELEALTLIKNMAYGSEDYKKVCQSEGIQHHYKVNRHHPEHFENGVDGMNLVDLIEYFLDCLVASIRRSGSFPNFDADLKRRHGLSDQLVSVFQNTLELMDELKGEREW